MTGTSPTELAPPRLEKLERLLNSGNLVQALDELYRILIAIDQHYGRLDGVRFVPDATRTSPEEACLQFATRFTAAFGRLVCHPDFSFTDSSFERLHQLTRWIELMSSLSGFVSADSFIRQLGADGPDIQIPPKDFPRLFTLYLPNSSIDIPFEVLQAANPAGFLVAALGWLGSRYCFNEAAAARREKLLDWLPGRFGDVKLGEITLANISEPFFHTSYAMTPRKHEIKKDLVAQLRRGLLAAGCVEWSAGAPVGRHAVSGKPVIVVTAEYLNKGHSIHRTHSISIRSLRRRFHVVGICPAGDVASAVGDLFDEGFGFPDGMPFYDGVRHVAEKIRALAPAAVVHMAVGMKNHTIALAALRLAPVQFVSYGHMATTHSPAIDYVVLPEDFNGDSACFSEKVVALPQHAMPYEPRTDIDYVRVRLGAQRRLDPDDKIVHVAVPASLMKLSPLFFATLRRISDAARHEVVFHFFPGFAVGLAHAELQKRIRHHLPTARINAELPYHAYCEQLAGCAFALNPFPYGNMNSLIESIALGLPGVCLDGPESHAHTDGAIYARLGFPACLNAGSIDDYVAQAVRLIDDADWRETCRAIAKAAPIAEKFYEGDERLFCDAIHDLTFEAGVHS